MKSDNVIEAVTPFIVTFTITFALIFAGVQLSKLSFNFGNKWMTGKELAANNADTNTPEAQAMITSFDKDNGKVYCVPKMSGAELGEFRAKIPSLVIGSVFQGIFNGDVMKDFNQNKPIESVLRMSFTKSHPCK
jgi:hypothetical protein